MHLFRMLKVMTCHGTALRMMRYKRIATSGIISLGRKSSSLRGPLSVEAARGKHVLGEMANGSNSNSNDAEKRSIQFIERKWLHHCSKSLWSCRGGETGTGDKTTSKPVILNDDIKKEFSSSSSSSSDTSSNENSKNNQRTTSPIGSQTYEISVGTEQGYRSYMEDEYYVSNDGDFAAVFDGHGGPAVSRYLRKNLYANVQAYLPLAVLEKQGDRSFVDNESDVGNTKDNLQAEEDTDENPIQSDLSSSPPSMSSSRRQRSPTVDDYANALESALEKVDSEILKISHWSFQGSTAIVIWLHEDNEERAANDDNESPTTQRTILAANIGDSRAVLCRDDKAWDLSRDHKPNDPTEKTRIESFGGSVVWCGETDTFGAPIDDRGIYRVNGNLALSRAIGDRSERPHVTAEPEIISVPVKQGDQFVIVATDGLWDVMDSDDAVNYVKLSLKAGLSKNKIADVMVQEAMRLGTYDNVTVVIIWIDPTS
jgi:serine/threonine protein phosphatase PrpC